MVELEAVPPFRLDLTVWALRRRARNRMDVWEDNRYRRVLRVDGIGVLAEVAQVGTRDEPRLEVSVSAPPSALTGARLDAVCQTMASSLGLGVDLTAFYRLARRDPHLAGLAPRFRGLKPPRFSSLFEALANAVACQQLSLEVGIELLDRLTAAYGRPAAADGSLRAFPEPSDVAGVAPAELRKIGFSNRKAAVLVDLAAAADSGELDALALATLPRSAATAALMALPGIGRWSAEYVLLRGLGRLDVYPGDDVGARNKLQAFMDLSGPLDYESVAQVTSAWAPFAGMAYFHLLLDGLASRGFV